MTTAEMLALLDQLIGELRPLYRELHTWARYELAERYEQPVPDLLPAHWLPNRWGQQWTRAGERQGSRHGLGASARHIGGVGGAAGRGVLP